MWCLCVSQKQRHLSWSRYTAPPLGTWLGFSSHPPLTRAPLCSAQPAQTRVVALTIPSVLGIGQVAKPQGL